jgi:hypothetical protein
MGKGMTSYSTMAPEADKSNRLTTILDTSEQLSLECFSELWSFGTAQNMQQGDGKGFKSV